MACVILVMGITAAGKSTAARGLAQRLGFACIEADDYHAPEAVDKMARGEALTDEDRWPWLNRLKNATRAAQSEDVAGVILACSALKRVYRDLLAPDATVYLELDLDTAVARANRRPNHFAKANLIESQLATLEPPTPDERPLFVMTAPELQGLTPNRFVIGDMLDDMADKIANFLAANSGD